MRLDEAHGTAEERTVTQAVATNEPTPTLDRALPGWAVDAIAEGVPTRDGRQVYGMCVRIAMSAYRRGWTEPQFVNEIAAPTSRLWAQIMTRRDGRTSSMPVAMKSLRKAWTQGVANANSVGMRTRDEIAADAVELAYAWADRLDNATDGLSATETAVMRYVVAETTRRGMLRVTCPRRIVAEHAGIGEEAAKGALRRLADRGLLVKHSAGRPGEPGKGRAAIFGLGPQVWEHPIEAGNYPYGVLGCGEQEPTVSEPTENEAVTVTVTVVEPATEEHPIGERPGETPHRGTTAQTNPWWREMFDEALRAAGGDPDALDDRTRTAVERARDAGYDAGMVAEALVNRRAGVA